MAKLQFMFFSATALCAGALLAANPFDDVRYWFRGESVINAGKTNFIDFVHGAQADHPWHTMTLATPTYAPIEPCRGAVRKNLAAETLENAPYLNLVQEVKTNKMVTIEGTDYPEVTLNANFIILPDFLSGLTFPVKEYTVFIRFRQNGLVSKKQDMNNFLQVGFQWAQNGGSGISVGMQRSTETSRYPLVFVGGQQKYFSGRQHVAEFGQWNELAVVVKGQAVGIATCTWGTNDVSRIFAYSEQTFDAAFNPAIPEEKAHVRLIGGEEAGQVTFTDGYNGTDGSKVKAFRGDVQTYAFWSRALTTNELLAVFNECRPNVMWKGLANGHSLECADWNPVLDETHPAVSITFTNDYFSSGLPQVLRVKSVEGSAFARLAVTLDGHDVGRMDCVPKQVGRVYVKGSLLAKGEHTLVLTRCDGGTGSFTIDALMMSGSHRIGTGEGEHGGMEHEQYQFQYVDPRIFYPEDGNLQHFSRGFSSGNNKIKVLPFWVEKDECSDSVFQFNLTRNANGQTFDIYLNGEELGSVSSSSETARLSQAIPGEKLRVGENRIEVRQTSDGWVNCASYDFSLGKWKTGMHLILR